MKNLKLDIVIFFSLLALIIATRILFHIGPNVEFVTISSLIGGYFFSSKKLSFLLPLMAMAMTEAILGNTSIFIFTWSAFLFTPMMGMFLKSEFIKNKLENMPLSIRPAILGLGGAALSVVIFYLWTNFGVVVTTNMYPDTIQGLINSYINALPFLKNQLAGNILTAPLLFTLVSWAYGFKSDPHFHYSVSKRA